MSNSNLSGHLAVGGGHKIYYEQWGNTDKPPILFLHGGPGGGFSDSVKYLFDDNKHHVIFFDQRGAGRSIPEASIKDNTTMDLIEDINKLLKHLNIQNKITIIGGSWGSTLALIYAINYPKKVKSLILYSLWLGRQFELDLINEGYAKYLFPEAWNRFISCVPPDQRSSGRAVLSYYHNQIHGKKLQSAKMHADEWSLWEYSLLSLHYNHKKSLDSVIGSDYNLYSAKLETHYFINDIFVEENYIINHAKKLHHIPIALVHGRFDVLCPPIIAYDFQQAMSDNLTLHWVNSGHKRSDNEMQVALSTIINCLDY